MNDFVRFAHEIYYVLYLFAEKYNNKSTSKDLASFGLSIYIGLFVLMILLVIDVFTGQIFLNDMITKYILIGIPVVCYASSLLYFSYKKRYLIIYKEVSGSPKKKEILIRQFAWFNIVLFLVFIMVSML